MYYASYVDKSDIMYYTPLDVRPDSIDLLFLGAFPDPFERVERDKNTNKRKKGKN